MSSGSLIISDCSAAKPVKRTSLLPADVSSKQLATSEQLNQQNMTRCSHCENLLEPLNIGAGTIIRIEGRPDEVIEIENSKTMDRPSRIRRQKKVNDEKEIEWEIVSGM